MVWADCGSWRRLEIKERSPGQFGTLGMSRGGHVWFAQEEEEEEEEVSEQRLETTTVTQRVSSAVSQESERSAAVLVLTR